MNLKIGSKGQCPHMDSRIPFPIQERLLIIIDAPVLVEENLVGQIQADGLHPKALTGKDPQKFPLPMAFETDSGGNGVEIRVGISGIESLAGNGCFGPDITSAV